MKVYILYSYYYDSCDVWENIVDIYSNYDDALMAQIILEQDNPDIDKSRDWWDVREFTLK